ncbi:MULTISPECIES: N-acetyl-D-Glu racemase DgcA [unclassified Sphingopyxis]|uniref:N-acetyl-D-Glu racemase DgcA n=1 Tax=unclassified Sphingopyxis TaxID=2614943 RepID=UPI0007366B72|nr:MULTISPECIES: N-acetyl-D-Glu racemase DgcA [unclassified Sphingopyxis]KTE30859.1 dipeptide epimerase [Sphingopyxis sp. HIX]KTE74855.1 dipeptide epimerase [Sphingopyxis sp. HXXIV]
MRRSLTVAGETLPLHTPFRISRGTKTAAQVVTVSLSQDGVTGRGECVPYPRYGENEESTILAIEAARDAIEQGVTRHELLAIMPAGAARNAVDCALWDLELRLAGSDIAAALGLEKPLPPIVTAMTISLDTPDRMAAAAAALADAPLLKVKVDRSDPAAQIKAVRAAAPKPKMIVDPNESWTIAEVAGLQDLLVDLRIDLLEQPLPADADSDLAGFRSAIPIAGDEAVHVAADLDTLPDGYGVVNIKLDKTGGLTAALELAEAARDRRLGVMTGCMICSSLSIAPAWAIAATSSFADLDGPLWLAEDRPGGVRAANGILSPPQPGFWGGI